MKIFLIRALVFCIPVIVVCYYPFATLFFAGETTSIEKVIEIQTENPETLYGCAYTYQVEHYKLKATQKKKPDILVLGTSRTMQYRAEFFHPEKSFYNAGGGVSDINHYRAFLNRIAPEHLPKSILLAFDQNFFNEKWSQNGYGEYSSRIDKDIDPADVLIKNPYHVYTELFNSRFNISDAFNPNHKHIGMMAIKNGDGFRIDGSFYHHALETLLKNKNYNDSTRIFEQAFRRIDEEDRRFEYCQTLDPKAIAEVDSILAFCHQHQIKIIGTLPPYGPKVYEKMEAMGDHYSYIKKLPKALKPIFDQYEYPFFDYTDPRILQGSNNEFVDGWHPSEKCIVRMIQDMYLKEPSLIHVFHSGNISHYLELKDQDFGVVSSH